MSSPLQSSVLLKYIAVGRIGRDNNNELIDDKIGLIAHNIKKDDPDSKNIKAHLRAILKKGAQKILPGKRIRLRTQLTEEEKEKAKKQKQKQQNQDTEDGGEEGSEPAVEEDKPKYDVHILAEKLDEDDRKLVVFFGVTDADFPKYHSIANLLRDIKEVVYSVSTHNEIWTSSGNGVLHRSCQNGFTRISQQYASHALKNVKVQVEQVKGALEDSVRKALSTVESLEVMEEKSDSMEESTKVFEKRGREFKNIHRNNYYKLTACVFLVVVALLCAFIIPAAIKPAHSGSNNFVSSSSSSTGGASNSSTSPM